VKAEGEEAKMAVVVQCGFGRWWLRWGFQFKLGRQRGQLRRQSERGELHGRCS
jgi:hypothetical protein